MRNSIYIVYENVRFFLLWQIMFLRHFSVVLKYTVCEEPPSTVLKNFISISLRRDRSYTYYIIADQYYIVFPSTGLNRERLFVCIKVSTLRSLVGCFLSIIRGKIVDKPSVLKPWDKIALHSAAIVCPFNIIHTVPIVKSYKFLV